MAVVHGTNNIKALFFCNAPFSPDFGYNWGNFLVPAAAGDYAASPSSSSSASTSWHEHPTKEDLFDLDWDQVDERYDPRLLTEDLINESQSDHDKDDNDGAGGSGSRRQAEHCYFEAQKYDHGQKVSGWTG